jgi:hypothetical protein
MGVQNAHVHIGQDPVLTGTLGEYYSTDFITVMLTKLLRKYLGSVL